MSSGDKSIFLARLYYVFNLDQCKDLEGCEGSLAKLRARADVSFSHQPVEACEAMVSATGADIRNGGLRAFYNYAEDYIGMPARSSFVSADRYYSTMFHELTHWTGKAGRCNRDLTKGRFGNPEYAAEELVAELGAAFLANRFGFDVVTQSASYLKNWLKALKDDASMLVTAASAAQKAVDFLAPSAEEADAEEIEA
jgi:antirestriction protein ArdC